MVTRRQGAGTRPLESAVQAAYFDWVRRSFFHDTSIFLRDYVFAIPNGQMLAGNSQQRARMMNAMKRRGFKNGVSDVMIALPRGMFSGAFLELKRDKAETASEAQIDFQVNMTRAGYWCRVAHGLDEAIKYTLEYLAYGP